DWAALLRASVRANNDFPQFYMEFGAWIVNALDRWLSGNDGDSSGWDEGEVGGGNWDVFFKIGEGEFGGGPVGLLELHASNGSGGGDNEGEQVDALLHALGDAGDAKVGAVRGGGEVIEFLG